MKRQKLVKIITDHAKTANKTIIWREGGSHTVVKLDNRQSSIPRHKEINELTAKRVLKQLGIKA